MLLELKGVQKRFGGVVALRNGDLSVNAGEVHLVMGENGAGKSTMMKIIAGLYQRDGGEMKWRGESVNFTNPVEAAKVGIAMVHQESLLAPHLSVAENIFMGREMSNRFGLVDRGAMIAQARKLIEEHHFPLQGEWTVERLSPAGKQLVEICRAIQHGTSLLIFDEPTSSLSEAETHEVFKIVRTLRDRGTGVIYITHRMDELRSVGDRVTILRDGETVHSESMATLSTANMIRYMVGREVAALYEREPVKPGAELLRVHNLTSAPAVKRALAMSGARPKPCEAFSPLTMARCCCKVRDCATTWPRANQSSLSTTRLAVPVRRRVRQQRHGRHDLPIR